MPHEYVIIFGTITIKPHFALYPKQTRPAIPSRPEPPSINGAPHFRLQPTLDRGTAASAACRTDSAMGDFLERKDGSGRRIGFRFRYRAGLCGGSGIQA